ncbi:LCP family protein [Falsarthrobacter nasiphocae]|uniref:LCP family protein required for cell wall assembly n=1 Tax=Falsarthrobacter nasiphocae TaxID=189863 RepID=A0AAE3YE57_9MICC|nr:LCP family protein [Falsarthrobacter nasiphocae]MDR6891077.1 LCP family protein required for cell wall assembly [Falsarthrobacter nasiphocae]
MPSSLPQDSAEPRPVRGRWYRRSVVERDPAVVAKDRRRRLAMRVTSCVLVLALVVAGGFVAKLRGNVQTAPLTLGAGGTLDDGPLDILLLGTDTRSAENAKYGGSEFTTGEGHSDVMMLMHMSADRKRVTVVSFPRDTLVPLPACTDPHTGKTYPAQDLAMLNYALSYGGPGCTVAAINKLTGLNIDHFMMADFTAVKEISNVVGGVDVCLNSAVTDPMSGLKLPAGVSSVKGDSALAYLRTRHGFSDGGDIGRIRAQQAFMASLTRKIKSENTLTNLPRLYRIADAMTQNLTVDEGLSNIPTLIAVAKNMNDADLGDIAFVTLPTITYEPDPNRLAVDESKASRLFDVLRRDGDVTERPAAPAPSSPAPSPSATDTQKPSASRTPTPSPTATEPALQRAGIPVYVINALGDTGRPAEVVRILKKAGYTSAEDGGKGDTTVPATQILYTDGYEEVAKDLAAKLKVNNAQLVKTASVVSVQVLVGEDFAQGTTVSSAKDTVGGGLSGQTANQVTCQQGNPSE